MLLLLFMVRFSQCFCSSKIHNVFCKKKKKKTLWNKSGLEDRGGKYTVVQQFTSPVKSITFWFGRKLSKTMSKTVFKKKKKKIYSNLSCRTAVFQQTEQTEV